MRDDDKTTLLDVEAPFELSAETIAAREALRDTSSIEEFEIAAKHLVDSATKDCIKYLLDPVVDLALWILYAQELARFCSKK